MNERMKRILSLVQQDIKDNAATIEYQKMDAEKRQRERDLKVLKPQTPRLANLSNLMSGNE